MTALRKYDAKRDNNEPEIVDAFRALGCLVHRIDQPCDLLLYIFASKGERMHLVEVKAPKGQLNDKQRAFQAAGWPVHVIRSGDEAIELVQRLRRGE